MKYWKVVITLVGNGIKVVDTIVIEEVITDENILLNTNPISFEDSSEQSFTTERGLYKMLWKQHNTPHFSRTPMSDKGNKMLSEIMVDIREKFPEVMI